MYFDKCWVHGVAAHPRKPLVPLQPPQRHHRCFHAVYLLEIPRNPYMYCLARSQEFSLVTVPVRGVGRLRSSVSSFIQIEAQTQEERLPEPQAHSSNPNIPVWCLDASSGENSPQLLFVSQCSARGRAGYCMNQNRPGGMKELI